jgi:uncharacterized membrane protein YhaH (DUF805 family)
MSGWLRFSGRMSRRRFWLRYVVPLAALMLCAVVLDGLMITHGICDAESGVLTGCAALAAALSMLSACVRRLHDMGYNGGWVLLLAAVPFVSPLVGVLLLGCLPGTKYENRFGPATP